MITEQGIGDKMDKGKVILIPWTFDLKDDLIRVCNLANHRFLSDRLPNPYTSADADRYLSMVKDHDEKDGIFRAVEYDGKIVGTITIEQKSGVHSIDCDIGYFIIEEYWSRGIVTEAISQICREAFEKLDLKRITSIIFSPNIGSRRAVEKNGFVLEGICKNAIFKDGVLYDKCIYAKYRD